MRKNINYIIILIFVILLSIFMDQYKINKQEGYAKKSCEEMNTFVNEILKEKSILGIQNINTNGLDYTNLQNYTDKIIGNSLYQIISFFISIDMFHIITTSEPNFFSEIFANPDLTDSDFIVLYSSYNSLIFTLHNIRMSIININPNIKTKLNIPICKHLSNQIVPRNTLNEIKRNSKKYINTFKKILDNINITNNTLPTDDILSKQYVDNLTEYYHLILNIKQCSNTLLNNLEKDQKNIIYPFLDLIRNYIAFLINLLNLHFVPALNDKLKNGQQIQIQEVPFVMPDDSNRPIIKLQSLGDNSLVKMNNSLIQGPGASYA